MGDELVVKALNQLLHINGDRVDGYETASQLTTDRELRDLFHSLVLRSRTFKIALQSLLSSVGAAETKKRPSSGKMQRFQKELRHTSGRTDNAEILRSCELGEVATIEAYQDVLHHADTFSENVVGVLRQQEKKITSDRDRIHRLLLKR